MIALQVGNITKQQSKSATLGGTSIKEPHTLMVYKSSILLAAQL